MSGQGNLGYRHSCRVDGEEDRQKEQQHCPVLFANLSYEVKFNDNVNEDNGESDSTVDSCQGVGCDRHIQLLLKAGE